MTEEFFQPYEERLTVDMVAYFPSLLDYPDSVWAEVSNAAGAQIVARFRSSDCAHFILSTSSLFIFPSSLMLLTCSPRGISDAFSYISSLMSLDNVKSVSAQKRFDPHCPKSSGKHQAVIGGIANGYIKEKLLPCAQLQEWSREAELDRDSAALLFFLPTMQDASELASRLAKQLPNEVKLLEHHFSNGGYSCNVTWGRTHYLTMHYSPRQYLSVDITAFASERHRLIQTVLASTQAETAYCLAIAPVLAAHSSLLSEFQIMGLEV